MSSYVVAVLVSALISALAAVSLSVVVNFAGRIALSHGVMLGLGAYSYALGIQQLGWSPWLTILLAPLVAGGVSALLAMVAGRMEVHVFLVATLALQFVGHEVFKRWDSLTNGDAGLTGIPRPGDMSETGLGLLALGILIVTVASLHRALKGGWGIKLRAIREDPDAAAAAGLSVQKTLLGGFVLSGAVAGVAGALHAAQVSYIVPDSFGLPGSLLLVVMCMVGGANVMGVATAGVVLVWLPEAVYTVFDLPSRSAGPIQELLYGGILILIMVFRPAGLIHEAHLRWDRRIESSVRQGKGGALV